MKLIAHYIFSFGVVVALLTKLPITHEIFQYVAIAALLLAWSTNHVIDLIGHTHKLITTQTGAYDLPVRSMVTHSIFTAPLWGILLGLLIGGLFTSVFGAQSNELIKLSIGLGVLVAYTHLFLDAFTQAGIFLFRNRIAIAHLTYNNPAANGAAILLGIVLIYVSSQAYISLM